jgi:2-dehydro-3-deoxyphosphogluconate aldolase / (4S)-4-hydroxy-2-oxoglutarate aldolase
VSHDPREQIRRAGAVAILRLADHTRALDVARALADAGLDVIEVTLDHAAALDALRTMADALPEDVLLGAGTVRRPEQVTAAAAAGARFCVSPNVDAAVIRAGLDAGLEPLPGAFTATEVAAALDAGARMLKLFPAGPLGPGYLRALLGPFRAVELVPTGGIGHDAVEPWLEAGAAAVGLGSDLVGPRPSADDLDEIARRARLVVEQVAGARAGVP